MTLLFISVHTLQPMQIPISWNRPGISSKFRFSAMFVVFNI
jgi:hypothetical protein